MKPTQAKRPVIVCTAHRGVFFGYVSGDGSGEGFGPEDSNR